MRSNHIAVKIWNDVDACSSFLWSAKINMMTLTCPWNGTYSTYTYSGYSTTVDVFYYAHDLVNTVLIPVIDDFQDAKAEVVGILGGYGAEPPLWEYYNVDRTGVSCLNYNNDEESFLSNLDEFIGYDNSLEHYMEWIMRNQKWRSLLWQG